MVRVVAHEGRQVERVERPVWPCSSRYLNRPFVSNADPEARELAHRPEPASISGGMDAPGKRSAPGTDFGFEVDSFEIARRIEPLDRPQRDGRVSPALT